MGNMMIRRHRGMGVVRRLGVLLLCAAGFVPAFGFLPMARATGTGAEVQRPLATVVRRGLMISTALVLLVLQAIYKLVLPESKAPRVELNHPALDP